MFISFFLPLCPLHPSRSYMWFVAENVSCGWCECALAKRAVSWHMVQLFLNVAVYFRFIFVQWGMAESACFSCYAHCTVHSFSSTNRDLSAAGALSELELNYNTLGSSFVFPTLGRPLRHESFGATFKQPSRDPTKSSSRNLSGRG